MVPRALRVSLSFLTAIYKYYLCSPLPSACTAPVGTTCSGPGIAATTNVKVGVGPRYSSRDLDLCDGGKGSGGTSQSQGR